MRGAISSGPARLGQTDSGRRRRGSVTKFRQALLSPAAAFTLIFPTIGFYTLATYVNVFAPEGPAASIAIRGASLALVFVAMARTPRDLKTRLPLHILPAGIFVAIYAARLGENILLQDMNIPPGTNLVLSIFFLSSIVPAYALMTTHRVLRDDDMKVVMSLFVYLFLVGMFFNRGVIAELGDKRLILDKINPISLAYVCSSILLYFIVFFSKSNRVKIEAIVVVPLLFMIAALARSRGMMIASTATLLIYVLVLRGSRRVWVVALLAAGAAGIAAVAKPEYFTMTMAALNHLGTPEDESTTGRIIAFHGAWRQFQEDPLLGRYVIEQVVQYYPHNIYLEVLMAVGLVGAVPFFGHVVLALRGAIGLIRMREGSATATFIALLFIRDAIGSAGSGGVWGVSGFWLSSFLVIAMWYGRPKNVRMRAASGPRAGAADVGGRGR